MTWITLKEAASRSGYHPNTLHYKIDRGYLQSARATDGRVLLRADEVAVLNESTKYVRQAPRLASVTA